MGRQFLVIQTAFLGDVILATAVIEKLHRSFPDAAIDFVVRKGNEGAVHAHPHLREVFIWDKADGKYRALWRLSSRLRHNHYDAVFNLQRFLASGMLTLSCRARIRSGFDKNPLSAFFTHRFPHRIDPGHRPVTHEIHRVLSLLAPVTDTAFILPRLYPSASDHERVAGFIAEPFVTISPASVWYTKQWPAEKWAGLLGNLSSFRVYLLGSKADERLCREVAQASGHPSCTVLAGQLTILQSAALMRHARMNFTNDSAPLHICTAVDAPVTAVFCSTVPGFGFGPAGEGGRVVETAWQLDCRPCGLHGRRSCPQGHFRCADIDVRAVAGSLSSGA